MVCEDLKKKQKKDKSHEKTNHAIFLNRNINIFDYSFEKYTDCGMKLDVAFAIDLSKKSLSHCSPNLLGAKYFQFP